MKTFGYLAVSGSKLFTSLSPRSNSFSSNVSSRGNMFDRLVKSLITDRIGRHEVLFPVNHKYSTFRRSSKRKKKIGEKFGKFSILRFSLKFRFLRLSCRHYGDYIEVCGWFISNAVLIVIGLSNCPITNCPIT